jgi:hypothetical protein
MMIGQTEVMKITKIADGWLSRKRRERDRQPGQRRDGAQHWKIGSSPRMAHTDWPMMVPSAMPMTPARPVADRDALQRGEHAPAQPDVLRPHGEERLDDEVARLRPDLGRRRQRGARPVAQHLPDDEQQPQRHERRDHAGCRGGERRQDAAGEARFSAA